MNIVAIVDYGLCNLDSIARAVEECGSTPLVTEHPDDLQRADRIILPGVGSFADAMNNLRAGGMEDALNEEVHAKGVRFLGICLGMQLMATKGWEGGETAGLGWIDGEVRRLEPDAEDFRIPHVGWNEVDFEHVDAIWEGIAPGKDFYFVHSYRLGCDNRNDVLAYTPYCGGFVSAVKRGSIYGVQFHPEKSQKVGLQLLRNFLSC